MLAKPPDLTEYLGKKMSEICTRSVSTKVGENQCAHFVSHVMEYDEFEYTCKNYTSADKLLPNKGAAIRVDDIFNIVPEYGRWTDKPLYLTSCLIFATNSGNMSPGGHRLKMLKGRAKHIGIYIDGAVWHYSNTRDGVAKDQEKLFINKFRHTPFYKKAGQTVDFFYGRFLK